MGKGRLKEEDEDTMSLAELILEEKSKEPKEKAKGQKKVVAKSKELPEEGSISKEIGVKSKADLETEPKEKTNIGEKLKEPKAK